MSALPHVVFWAAAGLVAYVYVGYPLALATAAALRPRRPADTGLSPTVSVIVPAYNEARVIEAKVKNSLQLDTPHGAPELIVVSDGSTDGTAELARRADDGTVVVIERSRRGGKANALNSAAERARGEVLVFTDANVFLAPDAVRNLVAAFADPQVGCAVGRVLLTEPDSSELVGEGLYMRYERWIHAMESRLGTMVGVDGAMFAIRRHLFVPLPPDAVVEDFVTAMRCVERGYLIRFVPEAVGYEEAAASVALEFRRKTRMIAGGFAAMVSLRALLNPFRYPRVSFQLVSHKLLRWMMPWCMLVAVAASATLVRRPLYAGLLGVQAAFAGCALLAALLPRLRRVRLFYFPYYFVAVNVAALVGFVRFLRRSQTALWDKAAR